MADGFEPGRVVPELPMARLHGARVEIARMKRSLVYGSVVAVNVADSDRRRRVGYHV